MPSKKRPRVCTDNVITAAEPRPLPIPLDLRLDVLSRLDVVSLLRYAAACKSTRRDLLSQDFRRSLALRPEASGGFDPALLLGFSYRLSSVRLRGGAATAGDRVAQTTSRQGQHLLRFDATLLDSFNPVASRDGLVVLLPRPACETETWQEALSRAGKRVVCNSLTGQVSRLPPPPDVREAYPHALLSVVGAGRSFRLLAADPDLRTQTFSSEDGRWGAVVEPRHAAHPGPYIPPSYASRAMVLGATVYWLCALTKRDNEDGGQPQPQPLPHNPPCGIVSLDASTSQASRIDLPPGCLARLRFCQRIFDALMLAPSPDHRRLSVLVAEIYVISMWTLSGASEGDSSSGLPSPAVAARWTRQVVIKRHAIEHQPGPDYMVRFMGLGERSGTVVLQMDGIGLAQLNLGSREAAVVRREDSFKRWFGWYNPGRFRLCLHEIHLTALLQAMKPFSS